MKQARRFDPLAVLFVQEGVADYFDQQLMIEEDEEFAYVDDHDYWLWDYEDDLYHDDVFDSHDESLYEQYAAIEDECVEENYDLHWGDYEYGPYETERMFSTLP